MIGLLGGAIVGSFLCSATISSSDRLKNPKERDTYDAINDALKHIGIKSEPVKRKLITEIIDDWLD